MSALDAVVTIDGETIDAIIAHAREAAPAECCGLLVGRVRDIRQAVRARNLASGLNRFLIDPKDHLDAAREARRQGREIVGFYHSHPRSPAVPSETDLTEASYPDQLHLIVSLATEPPVLRIFNIGEGGFLELRFASIQPGSLPG